ncbi:hypothetical protein Hdeb2414_s0017g00503641 [Helianthus debilis subsp. tardiflorus]
MFRRSSGGGVGFGGDPVTAESRRRRWWGRPTAVGGGSGYVWCFGLMLAGSSFVELGLGLVRWFGLTRSNRVHSVRVLVKGSQQVNCSGQFSQRPGQLGQTVRRFDTKIW